MILHRAYLVYPKNQYIVTFEGGGPRTARQEVRITIESVILDVPAKVIQGTGTVEGLKPFAKESADELEHGREGKWKDFICVFDESGQYRGDSTLSDAIMSLRNKYGETAQYRLKSGLEPKTVALCGGLKNALAILKYHEDRDAG